ncbi:MAG: NADH-quinone oxidoreductase subunit N [Planctomycetes bacterium]|nr:NADH-quinone oxidoreductase subunit N [Planctomycetota bacterium]
MDAIGPRLMLLTPEILLFGAAVVAAVLGLSRRHSIRAFLPIFTCLALVASLALMPITWTETRANEAQLMLPMLGAFMKPLLAAIGILLVLVSAGSVDRGFEAAVARGRTTFDPQRVVAGEFYAFFLFSLIGAMLLCSATDLIWIFLAVELVSLPTYIMVAVGGSSRRSGEAAIKYFFLGALSTAVFLYGFAMIYGSTGSLELQGIRTALAAQAAGSGIDAMALAGLILAVLGFCFKITAVPMHFYAPDVYEGAPTHVTAFLAFVPKVAGFVVLIVLLACVGWTGHSLVDGDGVRVPYAGLPTPLTAVLWMVAVLTMTLGNIGALLQRSVKRLLAYSSIAHSGYLVIGLLSGGAAGIEAISFYLLAYGVMTTASFAAIVALERRGEEINEINDLAGLRHRQPVMAWMLAISGASLVGMPPFLGFFGKVYLFVAAFEADQFALVVIAVLNSAVSALYYLRLATVPLVAPPSARSEEVQLVPSRWPWVAAVVCGIGTVILPGFLNTLVRSAEVTTAPAANTTVESPAADTSAASLSSAASERP